MHSKLGGLRVDRSQHSEHLTIVTRQNTNHDHQSYQQPTLRPAAFCVRSLPNAHARTHTDPQRRAAALVRRRFTVAPFHETERNRMKPSDYCRQMCYKNVSYSNISIPLSMACGLVLPAHTATISRQLSRCPSSVRRTAHQLVGSVAQRRHGC